MPPRARAAMEWSAISNSPALLPSIRRSDSTRSHFQRLGRQVLLLTEIDRDVGLAAQDDQREVRDRASQALGRRAGQRGGIGNRAKRHLDRRLAQRGEQFDLAAEM